MTKTTSKLKTLQNLEPGECKWPIGDPRQPGFHFCGAQQVLGRPYCIEHWQLSFTTKAQQQEAAAKQRLQLASPARRAA